MARTPFKSIYLVVATMLPYSQGCGIVESLGLEDKKIVTIVSPPQEKKEEEPVSQEPPNLTPARYARRLSIDIAQRFPTPQEFEAITANPDLLPLFIQGLLAESTAPRAIASLHQRMWHLNADDLPDLDEFAATDPIFKERLQVIRRELLEEPLMIVRKVIESHQPIKNILTGQFSITTKDSRDFWGYLDDGEVWPGEGYRFIRYDDHRPLAGILSTNGFLSAFPGRREQTAHKRTASLLRELTCRLPQENKAHFYYDLSPSEMTSDLLHIAQTKQACSGCHNQFTPVSSGFSGLGIGDDVRSWSTFQRVLPEPGGNYNGHEFANLRDLSTLMADDPQFIYCETEKLMAALLQKPVSNLEISTIAQFIDEQNTGKDFRSALQVLFSSKSYMYGPVHPKTKGSYVRNSSGTRFLRKHHFEAILRNWAPSLLEDGVDNALEPGFDEALDEESMVPSSSYWHAVERMTRQIATVIVEHDLAAGRQAEGRYLLTLLPDDTGLNASSATVEKQMIGLWLQLTGETILPGSGLMVELQDFWNSTPPPTSISSYQRNWILILVAMMTHPSFLTY